MNWKICLWGIFHITPYYEFLKLYTYLKLDHFVAHIFPYHFRTVFWKFGKLDGSHGGHLLTVRTGNVMSYFVFVLARTVEIVYLLVYTACLRNYNFL